MLYLYQRFVILVLLAGLGLVALSQVVLREKTAAAHDHDEHEEPDAGNCGSAVHEERQASGWNLWWLAFPLLLGILLPARPLGSSMIANRGINVDAPLTMRGGDSLVALELPSAERSVLDWIRAFNYAGDPYAFAGQPADVTGFVYHDLRLPEGQFMVGRFAVTCCVADALAVGMVVAWPGAGDLPDNDWVRVRGRVQVTHLDGQALPMIEAESVESVPEPQQPYLFP